MVLLTLALVGGCAALPGLDDRASADRIAASGGMTPAREAAGAFSLLTYRRGLEVSGRPVSVYIEGDGRAWRGRRPPRDPTPPDPLGLRLAARDPSAAVLWIGRPCMYLGAAGEQGCAVQWWTSHRYAPDVVDALAAVIRAHVAPGRPFTLMGHSGGGVLAVLLAARFQSEPQMHLTGLISVSAPLDLAGWVRRLELTPLDGSLDPIDAAPGLAGLPQRHFAGGADEVVPADVVKAFVDAIPAPNRARLDVIARHSHRCCWEEVWADLRRAALPGH